ncbi:MAG: hypothetical protein HON70_03205 [Lentisphaerae bacterium]|nr:hypothetical protein [Lentisphaerota bacterium]
MNKDVTLLEQLAEYRVLTAEQIARLRGVGSLQVVRRRLGQLAREKLVESWGRGFGRRRGRPEKVYSIGCDGTDLLQRRGVLPAGTIHDQIDGRKACENHQLLLNWFRIHLDYVSSVLPQLTVKLLSSTSPFLSRDGDGRSVVSESFQVSQGRKRNVRFVPDAVFAITDHKHRKSVLFFLEVDMGTETVASPGRGEHDFRQKILNYQLYFKANRYRRYEKLWVTTFSGFRLLVLANSAGRKGALARLIQEMPPNDFIWLTDPELMFSNGLTGPIWTRGGARQDASASIVGSLCGPSALLPLKR